MHVHILTVVYKVEVTLHEYLVDIYALNVSIFNFRLDSCQSEAFA